MTTKRELLLHPVITKINQSGFSNLKMDDFIKIMPASRSTVYRYFSSRETIIEAVVDEYINYIDQFKVPQSKTTETECVIGFQKLLEQAIVFNGELNPLFLNDLKIEFPAEFNRLQNSIIKHDSEAKHFYINGQKNQFFNQQDIQLWILQDKVMIPKLLDPQFLFVNNLTLKKALTNYATMKAQQVLVPTLLPKFDLTFLNPIVKKISQRYSN
ncbi:TetR/AcrR family transcriptional regulator [Companilactobacillus kimchiensis]|uniref:HTH tetR-type domain-containing protein n=1 Tax=Companilactobacillus kimchiensis TaxID=993692 RepID=A0A0R2LDL4_9LACO|nr:TetR/AcrR family transcriptional regulator [Companilactobacillus kimchiensis]KRN97990.1 hypothetical protein IV57_GL001333 [Companilactobacillus kimchiensis]